MLIKESGVVYLQMGFLSQLLNRFGFSNMVAERSPISVFLLDDDVRRHDWFAKRFAGDHLDIAEDVAGARELLEKNFYDAIFLDHDLLPEHYHSETTDDERTGYAIAVWLAANQELHRSATITVHTRNADGAIRMVEELRRSGRNAEYVPFPLLAQKIKNYWQR
ncbi:MAG: cyclic-phosphate processing receiver domain-containing protein [Pyrinomonadaceae bacterium]